MNQVGYFIGQVLRIGLLLSIIIVSIGGVLYLMQYGHEIVNYHVFSPPELRSMSSIFQEVFTFSAQSIIEFGLLILVLTQVARVLLTVILFMTLQDYIFTLISLFIFIILIYGIFWRS